MRKKKFALLILAGIVAAGMAQAAVQSYKVEKYNVKMDVPTDWQSVQDLFGMPLMILGPEVNEVRPVVSVVPMTGEEVDQIDLKDTKKEEADFKAGREEWLAKMNGKSISYNPLKTVKFSGSTAGVSVGYRYELEGVQYAENTWFVTCDKTMYMLKALVSAEQEKANQKTMDSMIESFTCK